MSHAATSAVWARSQAKGAARLVLLAIADHHNANDGRCDPGVKRLAAFAAVDTRTVRRALVELVDLGELEVVAGAGTRGTNGYRLLLLESSSTASSPPVDNGEGVSPSPLASRPLGEGISSARGGHHALRTVIEPEENQAPPAAPSSTVDNYPAAEEVLDLLARRELRAEEARTIVRQPERLLPHIRRRLVDEHGSRIVELIDAGEPVAEVVKLVTRPAYARERAEAAALRAELDRPVEPRTPETLAIIEELKRTLPGPRRLGRQTDRDRNRLEEASA